MNNTMKAGVIEKKGSFHLREKAIPALKPGETLIRVKYCGICGSDVHLLHGLHPTATFPIVPGHEYVGEFVEACGEGAERYQKGDLVVAQPVFSCGNCQPCAKGEDNVCRSLRFGGVHNDGGFGQYTKALTRKVYKLPADIDLKLAALAEPIAVAVHDVRRSGLQVGETALVIGGGTIGLLEAIIARHAGAGRIVISEISEFRRKRAEELGFETVNPLDADFDRRLMDMTDSLGFDVVFECSGSRAGAAAMTKYAKITGKIMIIGLAGEPYPVDLLTVFAKELTLIGVRIHAQYNFIGAVELLKSGKLNDQFAKIVTDVYPVDRLEEAFAYAQTPGDFLKIVVDME